MSSAHRLVAINCDTYRSFPCFVRLLDNAPEDGIRPGRFWFGFLLVVTCAVLVARQVVAKTSGSGKVLCNLHIYIPFFYSITSCPAVLFRVSSGRCRAGEDGKCHFSSRY